MDKDYYSFKEILLAFREEYQKNAKELAILKKYVTIMDRKLEDLNFYMRTQRSAEEDLKLLCSYIKRKNQLQQYLEMLSKKMGFYIHRTNIGNVEKSATGIYQIKGHYRLEITDNNSFAQQVEKLQKSEFVKEFSQKTICTRKNDIETILEQDISELNASRQRQDQYIVGISYDPVKDTVAHIDFQQLKEGPEQQMVFLDAFYDIKFPREAFSTYQQQIIEESKDAKREILIEKEARNIYKIDNKGNEAVILRKVKR